MKPSARLGVIIRSLAVTAIAVAGVGFAGASPALAGGPPAPVPVAPASAAPPHASVPGGYFRVLVSQQVCQAGAVIGPVRSGQLTVTLRVPRGAFPFCVQVTLTKPNAAAIGNAHFACFQAIGGVGVIVQRAGRSFPGPFSKPLSLHLAAASISRSSLVVRWNGSRFAKTPAAITAGSAVVDFSTSPADFAVLTRVCNRAIAGATKAGTGKPLLGEGLLAGVLVLSGAGVITYACRRPRPRAERV